MTWRAQKDDPIEKCEEAKRVWVIFKEGSGYESYNPEICFFDKSSWSSNGEHVEIINTDGLLAPLTDIDRWQVCPTPTMPSTVTEGEDEKQRKVLEATEPLPVNAKRLISRIRFLGFRPLPNDIVIIRISEDDRDQMSWFAKLLEEANVFPNNKCMILVDHCKLETIPREQLRVLLDEHKKTDVPIVF